MKRLLISFLFLFALVPISPVYAQGDRNSFKDTALHCTGEGDAADVPTIQGIECLVTNVLAVAVTLVGIAAFVMFLVGGFQYLTSGANSKGVEGAKNSITYAIVGIIVALSSFFILNTISELTGVKTILNFSTQYSPPAR